MIRLQGVWRSYGAHEVLRGVDWGVATAAGGFELEFRAKTILGGLGFGPQDAARPLREFSGGFRMRAALGSLLLKNPDVLLLDEPTNHLDLDGVAWLESFLANSRSSLVI